MALFDSLSPGLPMSSMSSRRSFLGALSATALASLSGPFLEMDAVLAEAIDRVSGLDSDPHGLSGIGSEYLLDPNVCYLNHASIGTVPRMVHSAGIRYREICEENPWLYMWGGAWEEAREAVRSRAAAFLGAGAHEIAITHNTTEGFNVLAQGLPLHAGDEVLFSTLNHSGAAVCWHHYAQDRGYQVRVFEFPVGEAGSLSASDVIRIHQEQIRSNTRVLVFPHMDNIVGIRHPLSGITAMARKEGVEFVLVDGAQSAGMIPLDLQGSGVDAFATSPHKWIQSPKGLGIFYLRSGLLDVVRPLWVTWGRERWQGTARAFEDYGTRNLPEVLSLGDALDFQVALGSERKEREYRRMFFDLKERVDGTPGLIWRSPGSWEMGSILVGVGLEQGNAAEVSDSLFRDRGIVVRPFPAEGLNALRVSPNLLNSDDDWIRLLEILERK